MTTPAGLWNPAAPPLSHYYLEPTLEGFHAQLPPDPETLPSYAVKIWEGGLMEFGTDLTPPLTSGDQARDRLIPTHGVAVYLHDFALLFRRILEHVG